MMFSQADFKARAFFGARIALEGFDEKEKDHMIKLILDNEGQYVNLNDPTATHMVR
jgi:hypothetical protein